MKRNTFICLIACGLCLFFLTACPIKLREFDKRTRSYVLAFGETTVFPRMQLTNNNNIILYWRAYEDVIWFRFQSTGFDKRRYDELAARYNDLNYYRVTTFSNISHNPLRMYISNRITSIDVRSDTDFNAEHPAGASLSGFVRLLSASPMRFIESGYQDTFDWYNNYPTDFLRETYEFHRFIHSEWRRDRMVPLHQNHFPISEVLSALEPNDFRLLGIGHTFPLPSGRVWFFGFLVFDKEPDSPGTHNLTVTIRRANGQTLTQMIEKTFGS